LTKGEVTVKKLPFVGPLAQGLSRMTEKDRLPRWIFVSGEAWWGFLMAFRQFPGLRVSVLLAIATAFGAGCTGGPVSTFGFQPTDHPTTKSLPGDPVALTDSGQITALASPGGTASAPVPNPPSPLAHAMARADSHYERGLLAMRSGKTDQAEWEFDAALETLLDTGLGRPYPLAFWEPIARLRDRSMAGFRLWCARRNP